MLRTRKILVASAVCLGAVSLLHSQSQTAGPTPVDLLRCFKSLHVDSKSIYIKKE